ncbi:MAG: hypothetical protein V1817_00790 [Candidatus Micrarchaeota archaeon]
MPTRTPKTPPKPVQINIEATLSARKIEAGPDSRASEHALIKIASLIRHCGDETLLEVTGIDRHKDFVDANSGQVKTEVKNGLNEINIHDKNSPIVLSNLKQALSMLDGKLTKELFTSTQFHLVGADGRIGRKARRLMILKLFKQSGIMQQKYAGELPDEQLLQLAVAEKKKVFGANSSLNPEEIRHLKNLDFGTINPKIFLAAFFLEKLRQYKYPPKRS